MSSKHLGHPDCLLPLQIWLKLPSALVPDCQDIHHHHHAPVHHHHHHHGATMMVVVLIVIMLLINMIMVPERGDNSRNASLQNSFCYFGWASPNT